MFFFFFFSFFFEVCAQITWLHSYARNLSLLQEWETYIFVSWLLLWKPEIFFTWEFAHLPSMLVCLWKLILIKTATAISIKGITARLTARRQKHLWMEIPIKQQFWIRLAGGSVHTRYPTFNWPYVSSQHRGRLSAAILFLKKSLKDLPRMDKRIVQWLDTMSTADSNPFSY